jgi:hypothetical protein
MIWMDGGIRPMHPDLIPANESISNDGGANGIILHGTKGLMTIGMYGNDPKIYLNNGEKIEVPKSTVKVESLPEYGHQMFWTEACKAGFNSKQHKELTSSFDYSGPLTETVLMGNLAIRSYMLRKKNAKGGNDFYGRVKLKWDGANMKVTNFDDANQFVKREYRSGWEIKG